MGTPMNPATAPQLQGDAVQHQLHTESARHCLEKINECALRCAQRALINTDSAVGPITMGQEPLPRDLLQIGYNLGRLAEITGVGRAVWDATKGHVVAGEYSMLALWAGDLLEPRDIKEVQS